MFKLNKSSIKNIFLGTVLSFLTAVVLCFLFSVFLTLLNKSTYSVIFLFSHIIFIFSSFCGGYFSAKLNKENGLIIGSLSGICFVIITAIFSIILKTFNFNILILIKFVISVLSAGLGGIISVNKVQTVKI